MSDKNDFKSNLDAGSTNDNSDDNTDEKGNGLLGGISGLTRAAQEAAHKANANTLGGSIFEGAEGLVKSARSAVDKADQDAADNTVYGAAAKAAAAAADAAKAAADASAAAAKLREQAEAQSSADDGEFVGSGGVGSAEQLDAIRRGYAERGIADPSGLGGSEKSEA
jgi:hypothetical protein